MRLTKHVHACITIEQGGRSLLVDPGAFEPRAPELLAAADAVLLSHVHPDHFHRDALTDELCRRPGLPVAGPESVVGGLAEIGSAVTVVGPGDRLALEGLAIEVLGGTHAEIYPEEPRIESVGFLIGGRVFHPGDSYEVPHAAVGTLLVPVSGPWTRFADAAAFITAVSPRRAIAIHDAALSEIGLTMLEGHLGNTRRVPVALEQLAVGESTEV